MQRALLVLCACFAFASAGVDVTTGGDLLRGIDTVKSEVDLPSIPSTYRMIYVDSWNDDTGFEGMMSGNSKEEAFVQRKYRAWTLGVVIKDNEVILNKMGLSFDGGYDEEHGQYWCKQDMFEVTDAGYDVFSLLRAAKLGFKDVKCEKEDSDKDDVSMFRCKYLNREREDWKYQANETVYGFKGNTPVSAEVPDFYNYKFSKFTTEIDEDEFEPPKGC